MIRDCLLVAVCLVLFQSSGYTQADPDVVRTRYTNYQQLAVGNESFALLDTSLNEFHRQYYPLFRQNFALMDLGNSGTPLFPLQFNLPQQNGFRWGWDALAPYHYNLTEQTPYYNLSKPLSDLHYTQGANELIYLRAFHSQNINQNWNIGIDYKRMKEDGFYLRQISSMYNTRLFSSYQSADKRYKLLASAIFNRQINQENGGVISKDAFDTLTGPVRTAPTRFLTGSANNARQTWRSNLWSVTQLYRLGLEKNFPNGNLDTLGNPIIDTIPTFIPKYQIMFKTEYEWKRRLFTIDDLSGMGYNNFFRDSLATYDSSSLRKLGFTLALQSGQYQKIDDSFNVSRRKLSWEIGLAYHLIQTGWINDFAFYKQLESFGRIESNPVLKQKLNWRVNAWNALSGYNQGDYSHKAQLSYQPDTLWSFDASVQFKGWRPDFLQYYYFGNHQFWHNRQLETTHANKLGAKLNRQLKKYLQLEADAQAYSLNNYIYWNQEARPTQYTQRLSLIQASIKSRLKLGVFNWENSLLWQSTNQEILALPVWLTQQSIYAEGFMFKQALFLRFGADVCFSSTWKAPVYVPELMLFRNQGNNESFLLGAYPWVNIYASGRIKTVTFFVMFQHLNMGLGRNDYYSSPFYPAQPRALRFGLRWKMYE